MMSGLGDFMDTLDEPAWRPPDAFALRAAAIDRLDLLLVSATDAADRRRASELIEAMEAVDAQLFASLRAAIREGAGRGALAPWLPAGIAPGAHYDELDALLAGIFALREPDIDDPAPPKDMVFYQPTPARHIVDCVRQAAVGPDDLVLDIGSGLGHVPMLANILTDARTAGIEREPAYVDTARRGAADLALHDVSFIAGDARDADFSGATVFYLFTPFTGPILRDVVALIEREARRRPLCVVAVGPCTRTFARASWLATDAPVPEAADRAIVFRSRPVRP